MVRMIQTLIFLMLAIICASSHAVQIPIPDLLDKAKNHNNPAALSKNKPRVLDLFSQSNEVSELSKKYDWKKTEILKEILDKPENKNYLLGKAFLAFIEKMSKYWRQLNKDEEETCILIAQIVLDDYAPAIHISHIAEEQFNRKLVFFKKAIKNDYGLDLKSIFDAVFNEADRKLAIYNDDQIGYYFKTGLLVNAKAIISSAEKGIYSLSGIITLSDFDDKILDYLGKAYISFLSENLYANGEEFGLSALECLAYSLEEKVHQFGDYSFLSDEKCKCFVPNLSKQLVHNQPPFDLADWSMFDEPQQNPAPQVDQQNQQAQGNQPLAQLVNLWLGDLQAQLGNLRAQVNPIVLQGNLVNQPPQQAPLNPPQVNGGNLNLNAQQAQVNPQNQPPQQAPLNPPQVNGGNQNPAQGNPPQGNGNQNQPQGNGVNLNLNQPPNPAPVVNANQNLVNPPQGNGNQNQPQVNGGNQNLNPQQNQPPQPLNQPPVNLQQAQGNLQAQGNGGNQNPAQGNQPPFDLADWSMFDEPQQNPAPVNQPPNTSKKKLYASKSTPKITPGSTITPSGSTIITTFGPIVIPPSIISKIASGSTTTFGAPFTSDTFSSTFATGLDYYRMIYIAIGLFMDDWLNLKKTVFDDTISGNEREQQRKHSYYVRNNNLWDKIKRAERELVVLKEARDRILKKSSDVKYKADLDLQEMMLVSKQQELENYIFEAGLGGDVYQLESNPYEIVAGNF